MCCGTQWRRSLSRRRRARGSPEKSSRVCSAAISASGTRQRAMFSSTAVRLTRRMSVALHHQCGVRRACCAPPDWCGRALCRLLIASGCALRLRPDHRFPRAIGRTACREGSGGRYARLRQYRRATGNHRGGSRHCGWLHRWHRSQGRRRNVECGRYRPRSRPHVRRTRNVAQRTSRHRDERKMTGAKNHSAHSRSVISAFNHLISRENISINRTNHTLSFCSHDRIVIFSANVRTNPYIFF